MVEKIFWVIINVRIPQMLVFRDRNLVSRKLEKTATVLVILINIS